MNEKMLNGIALFVQELLRDKPKLYSEVRTVIMKKYNLGKFQAGNILSSFSRNKYFLYLGYRFHMTRESILYLPEQKAEALRLFNEVRRSVPFHIWYTSKCTHEVLLSEARKITLQNQDVPVELLTQVIKWKLKVTELVAKQLIGELKNL